MILTEEMVCEPGIDGLLDRLEGIRPTGAGWVALCPAHDDRKPSLSISEGDDGRVLLHCHAGCAAESILAAVGLEWRDLYAGCEEQGASFVPRLPTPLSEQENNFRDRVYQSLLGQMKLSDEHREHLRGRGLTDQAIEAGGYRSVGPDTAYLYPQPSEDFPRQRLLAVPGFRSETVKYPKDVVERKVTYFEATRGILIPVRDARSRIISAQVRRFDDNGPKYQWLRGSRSMPHVPLGAKAPCSILRVTEGPLKADVVTCLCPEILTVGIAGVASWRKALPLIEELGADEVRLAFDADWRENPAVANALVLFAEELDERGLTVTIETWDGAAGKGIDDLFDGGGEPQSISLAEAERAAAHATVVRAEGRGAGANHYEQAIGGRADEPHTAGPSNGETGNQGSPGRRLPSWPDPVPISHLAKTAGSELTWIWQDYVPDRSIVLLTALWKSGKTTLLGHFLSAMSAGKAEFCGRPLRKCKVLLLTQEQDAMWNQRREQFVLSDDVVFFQRGPNDSPRPFVARPNSRQWKGFVAHLAEVVREGGFELVVIDPLADFWPVVDENSATQVTDALEPLRQLHDSGCSVLLLHHPRKNEGGDGDTAHRGSGQLAAFPDVLIQMRRAGKVENRRRVLRAKGRALCPDDLTIELKDQGYVAVGSAEARPQAGQTVPPGLTEVANFLPTDGTAKSAKELYPTWPGRGALSEKWGVRVLRDKLNQAADAGLVVRSGTGRKNDLFRFRRK